MQKSFKTPPARVEEAKCGTETESTSISSATDSQEVCGVEIPDTRPKCDICSEPEEEDVMLKCVQCEETFCQNCAKCHRKQKATRDHQLHPVAHFEQEKKQTIHCTEHGDLIAEYFCTDCDSEICEECRNDDHIEHEVMLFDDLVLQSRNNLKRALDNRLIPRQMLECEDKMSDLLIVKEGAEIACDENIKAIQQRCEEFKTEIDKICEEFCQQIQSNMQNKVQLVSNEMTKVQNCLVTIKDAVKRGKAMLSSPEDMSVVKYGKHVEQELEKLSVLKIKLQNVQNIQNMKFCFQKKRIVSDLQSLIGTIDSTGTDHIDCLVPLSVFDTNSSWEPISISCLTSVGNDAIWFAKEGSSTIDMLDFKGVYHKSVNIYMQSVKIMNDIECGIDEKCFYSLATENSVYSFSKNAKNSRICQLVGMFPRGVCFQKDTKTLFFCANHSASYYATLYNKSTFPGYTSGDRNGIFELVKTNDFERIDSGEFDFGYFDKISVSAKGIICVTDLHNVRVVFFSSDGEANYFYSGPSIDGHRFMPCDVSSVSSDQFLVLFKGTSGAYGFIHILSECGVLLRRLRLQMELVNCRLSGKLNRTSCAMFVKDDQVIVANESVVHIYSYPD